MEAHCASCVAFDCGCCMLTELPTCEEDACPDYRLGIDLSMRMRSPLCHG